MQLAWRLPIDFFAHEVGFKHLRLHGVVRLTGVGKFQHVLVPGHQIGRLRSGPCPVRILTSFAAAERGRQEISNP